MSYYNYTGACRMDIHSVQNPAIAFAFIDDKLYARIIRTSGTDLDPDHAKFEERVSKQIGTSDVKKKKEGDLLIYQWTNEKEKTIIKAKINTKTLEQKGAYYYEPLRKQLESKSQTADPVDEIMNER